MKNITKIIGKSLFFATISLGIFQSAFAEDEFNFQPVKNLKSFHKKYHAPEFDEYGSPSAGCEYRKNGENIFESRYYVKRGQSLKKRVKIRMANLNGEPLFFKSDKYESYTDRQGDPRVRERWISDTHIVTLDRSSYPNDQQVTLTIYSKQTDKTKRIKVTAECFRE